MLLVLMKDVPRLRPNAHVYMLEQGPKRAPKPAPAKAARAVGSQARGLAAAASGGTGTRKVAQKPSGGLFGTQRVSGSGKGLHCVSSAFMTALPSSQRMGVTERNKVPCSQRRPNISISHLMELSAY